MSIARRTIDDAVRGDEDERRRKQILRNQPAIALLDSWAEADDAEIQEQAETWECLRRALDSVCSPRPSIAWPEVRVKGWS
jgi:hypothetical protein